MERQFSVGDPALYAEQQNQVCMQIFVSQDQSATYPAKKDLRWESSEVGKTLESGCQLKQAVLG